jgi:hypothetical protein
MATASGARPKPEEDSLPVAIAEPDPAARPSRAPGPPRQAPAGRAPARAGEILDGGVKLAGLLEGVPEALAVTDKTIEEVKAGAVRYAGSIAKLLG